MPAHRPTLIARLSRLAIAAIPTATAAAVVALGHRIGADIAAHASISGVENSTDAVALTTVIALTIKGGFAGLAALIRPTRVPWMPGRHRHPRHRS